MMPRTISQIVASPLLLLQGIPQKPSRGLESRPFVIFILSQNSRVIRRGGAWAWEERPIHMVSWFTEMNDPGCLAKISKNPRTRTRFLQV
ncbi:hypothetical protein LX36DRAFT_381149 [Colletotrichum falcatum]|nr:hypothetical protein LX36DRAFT_381149 [Colletotrichum falcatum]